MMIKINLKILVELKSWMIKLNKLSEFKSLIDASKALNKSGAKIIALEFLDRALAMDLTFSKERIVEVYKLRGKIRFGMDHIYQSINDFSYAIEIEPQNAELYYWRGMSYEYLNQNEEALKNLKMSLKLDPDFSLALSMVDYLENEKN